MNKILFNISSHDKGSSSSADIDYLNEISDVKEKFKELRGIQSIKEDCRVDHEYRGIKAGGFIHDKLVKETGNPNYNETTPEKIKTKDISRILHEHIKTHGGHKKIVAHKLIVSFRTNLNK